MTTMNGTTTRKKMTRISLECEKDFGRQKMPPINIGLEKLREKFLVIDTGKHSFHGSGFIMVVRVRFAEIVSRETMHFVALCCALK